MCSSLFTSPGRGVSKGVHTDDSVLLPYPNPHKLRTQGINSCHCTVALVNRLPFPFALQARFSIFNGFY